MNITPEPVEAYIDNLYKPLNSALAALRTQAETDGFPVILKSTETFLLNVINIKKPKNILEIGTAVGYSAACFAEKYKKCNIISIELDEETQEKAIQNLKDLGLSDRVTVLLGDAEEVIREKLSGYRFDLVFIDAAKSHYRRFFNAAVTVCEDEAVIISDDVLLKGGTASDQYVKTRRHRTNIRNMREFVAYITTLSYADTSIVPIGAGVALTTLHNK